MKHAKRHLLALAMVVGLAGPAHANDAGTVPVDVDSASLIADAPAPMVVMTVDPPIVVQAAAAPAEIPNPTVDELLQQLAQVRADYDAFRAAASGKPKRLAFYGLAVALLTLIIGVLNKAAHLSKRARAKIPLITGGLGVALGLFGSLHIGMPLLEAVTVGAIPPLSVWLHQLIVQPGKARVSE